MKKPFRVGIFIFGLTLAMILVCSGLYAGVRSFAPIGAQSVSTTTATPFLPATRTPTPFLPASMSNGGQGGNRPHDEEALPPLPLMTPTSFSGVAPWAPFAGPIYPADTPVPTPAAELAQGDDVMNVALLGMDLRPQGNSYRTDTIMILSLNRTKKTVALISFPRDLYVYIPAYGMQRINVAFPVGHTISYPGGRFALFQDTMRYNFGVKVDRYVIVNFWGFTALINSIGGVDINAATTYSDKRGKVMYTVYAGSHHMDGDTALWYARARYASNDFDRGRRQQEVIVAIMQKMVSLNVLADFPTVFNTLSRYVESDITLDTVTPYLEMAAQLSPSDVRRFGLSSPTHCNTWVNSQGALVEIPNYPAIRELLAGALSPS